MIVAVCPSPIVYAHVNGFTVLGAELPVSSTPGRGRDPDLQTPTRSSCLDWAQGVTDLATSVHHYAYMVGEYVGGARLLSAPLDSRSKCAALPPRGETCSRLALRSSGARSRR